MSTPLNFTALHFQHKKENKTIDGADKEILAEAERLDVKAMGPLILSELLFNENIRDQIKKYKRHFLRVSLMLHHCSCHEAISGPRWADWKLQLRASFS